MTAAQEYAQRAYAVVHRRGSNHLALLLHGLGGDSKQPIGLTTDQLAGTGVDVLAPDARAHGETPVIGPAERFTTEALAEDVLALVDRLAFAGYRLIPIGISMGAAVALWLAEVVPDRLAGALLIRPAFVPEPWPPPSAPFSVVAPLLRSPVRLVRVSSLGPMNSGSWSRSPHQVRSASGISSTSSMLSSGSSDWKRCSALSP
jgi:pimeloyl-ACP methyl ester carboxylesterase